TVRVCVESAEPLPEDIVSFTTTTTNLSGTPITEIALGQPFNVVVCVQDIRLIMPLGVFSAYCTVNYSKDVVSVQNITVNDTNYGIAQCETVPIPPTGSVEIGGVATDCAQTGPTKLLLATVRC